MTDQNPAETLLQKLYEFHQCKYKLLKEMHEVTSARSRLVDEKEIDQILQLTEVRQGCIEKIDILDVEIYEIMSKLKGLFDEPDVESSLPEKLKLAIDKIKEIKGDQLKLIGKMMALDKNQGVIMEKAFGELRVLRDKLKVGRQTLNAYHGKPPSRNSVFVDEKK